MPSGTSGPPLGLGYADRVWWVLGVGWVGLGSSNEYVTCHVPRAPARLLPTRCALTLPL
jgi:hypothetical protein